MKKIIFSTLLAVFVVAAIALAEFFPTVIVTGIAGKWTDTRAYTDVAAAITAIGANERILIITGEEAVGTLTIPINVRLKFMSNGSLAIATQLTLQTYDIDGGEHEIFSGAGDIDFAAGTVVRSAWFDDLDEALDVTLDDTLTMVISRAETLTADAAVGDCITLRWESPLIITSGGFNLTNLKRIESGTYQIFSGAAADDFDFLAGSVVHSCWFQDLNDVIEFTGDEDVELTILVDQPETIDFDVTVDEYQSLEVKKGCVIEIETGDTLTINGPFSAGPYYVFNEVGTGDVSGLLYVRPEWWYSGAGIWKTAFESAIETDRHIDLVGGKTYELSDDGLANATNISGQNNWILNGNGATLKFADGVTDGIILNIDDCDDVRILNVEFDGNIANGTEGDRQALDIMNKTAIGGVTAACNRVIVENCYIHDTKANAIPSDATGIRSIGTTDLKILGNTVSNTDVAIFILQSHEVVISSNTVEAGGASESVAIWGDADVVANSDVTIIGNIFKKQLSVAFVDGCVVSDNNLINMSIGGEHATLALIANDVVVSNNFLQERINIGSQNGALLDVTANDILISGNHFALADIYAINVIYKAHGITIQNNSVRLAQNATIGFDLLPTGTATNIVVSDNYIDTNGFTLQYFLYSSATPLYISNNHFEGAVTANGLIITSAAGLDDIVIAGNVMLDSDIRLNVAGPIKRLQNNQTDMATLRPIVSAANITLLSPSQHEEDDGQFIISGTTNITSMTASRPGHIVTLQFSGILTFTDGGNLVLAGDFVTTADDTIQLISDGTNWCEISRSVN